MKEDFFKLGYSPYLNTSKKQKWTSRCIEILAKHKLFLTITITVSICIIINFWLIFKFMSILEVNSIIY